MPSLLSSALSITGYVTVFVMTLTYLSIIIIQLRSAMAYGHATLATEPPPGHTWPLVSVLIPSYNEEAVIEATISSVLSADYPEIQVVVIDDGSEDRTAEIAALLAHLDSRIVLVRQPHNQGKAAALNAGIEIASSEYLVAIDADSAPDANFFRYIVAPLLNGQADAVAGNVRVGNNSHSGLIGLFQSIEYASVLNATRLLQAPLGAVTTVPGAAGSMRRQAVRSVGGYSHSTKTEDTELSMRLGANGFRIVYQPRAVVYTEAPVKWNWLFHQRVRWIYGNMQCAFNWFRGRLFSKWRLSGFIPFACDTLLRPPLEFYRTIIPALFLAGLLQTPLVSCWICLLFLNWLAVISSLRFEGNRATREILAAPLQYALWPLFLVFPYSRAVWMLASRRRLLWRKIPRAGLPSILYHDRSHAVRSTSEIASQPAPLGGPHGT